MTDSVEAKRGLIRVADRYEMLGRLGRGGMAAVHRVRDTLTGRELALKQLRVPEQPQHKAKVAALFEREYHILAQLNHPRVIAVYDYGVDPNSGAYYTMELLDGGDLHDRAPLPWRDACSLLFDVCSSLALLHSRRLLHRDISPRNVRCTHEGGAKLIDFGAMAPMGAGGGSIVGTPPFTPPETLQRSALDARADLFSLGATLYYALTGVMAYSARTFAEVRVAWGNKPLAPSARVPGIPLALDELVLSLVNIEPALRPATAFDVMQRLAAIADLECEEPEGVSRAYLSTPTLVGRDALLAELCERLGRSVQGHGGGVLIRAEAGLGRSRMLDACALEGKTSGATVLRISASGAQEPFSSALALLQHALETLPHDTLVERYPELFETQVQEQPQERAQGHPAAEGPARARLRDRAQLIADPERLQQAISRFLLSICRLHPLLIAVDDVERIDEPSAAVLATLADRARRHRMLVLLTAEVEPGPVSSALSVLSSRCDSLTLAALTREQTEVLLGSIFGDVAHLHLLARELHGVAQGNPRTTLDVVQHLLDRGALTYRAGTWTLPSTADALDLPRSAEDAIAARVDALSPLPRFLATAQALSFHELFSHQDFRALRSDLDPQTIDTAISELLERKVVTTDGETYALSSRVWSSILRARIDAGSARACHRALAELFVGKSPMGRIHHLFEAGLDEQGLDALVARHALYAQSFDSNAVIAMNAIQMGPSYVRAIETAQRLGRPTHQLSELRRWVSALGVVTDGAIYWMQAPIWLEQLKQDSGWSLWRADADNPDPGARLTRALTTANERYLATPEGERGYRVDEAIRNLAQYAAISVAIGTREQNIQLLSAQPGLLEPFVMLSPVLHAVWQSSQATCEAIRDCRITRARARWLESFKQLAEISGADLQHVDAIRNAVAYGIGTAEIALGLPSAATWAARLDGDVLQRVSGVHLRRLARLEQGDWSGAERLQRQVDVMELQARAPQMFNTLLAHELSLRTHARDLSGVKAVMEKIALLAARYPGWEPMDALAKARFELVRGDLEAARAGFVQCIELTERIERAGGAAKVAWGPSRAGLSETLLLLGRAEEARACASEALRVCEAQEVDSHAPDIIRVLSLAEGQVGDIEGACARLEALIERQEQLGVSGLKLGLSFEARAQLALLAGDLRGFERFARRTAREYRHGARCPLSARYERLIEQARRSGLRSEVVPTEIAASLLVSRTDPETSDASTLVGSAMIGAHDANERALRALRLVCDSRATNVGHFYFVEDGRAVCAATFGPAEAPSELGRRALQYLAHERDRADTQTVVASSAVSDEVTETASLVHIRGVVYELMLVSCVVLGSGKEVGVIALELAPEAKPARNAKQAQLLSAIASYMVQVTPAQTAVR